jgi:hypothetical protein
MSIKKAGKKGIHHSSQPAVGFQIIAALEVDTGRSGSWPTTIRWSKRLSLSELAGKLTSLKKILITDLYYH